MNATFGTDIKNQVRQFYDQVGWQEIGEGVYQNAQYEDLRPVSREYIHRCHLRVKRYLQATGGYFLDAGSGPIQYPEYLEYSNGYHSRVCADISIVALQEARKRIGDVRTGGHGMFVVADIAHLPFVTGIFDGLVSLHTIHHLPGEEHQQAYFELHRVIASGRSGVIVNGWESSILSRVFVTPLKALRRTWKRVRRKLVWETKGITQTQRARAQPSSRGTYVTKNNAEWLRREVGNQLSLEIFVWRTVNVRFLKAYIHQILGGKYLLRFLYKLEEKFPQFLGEHGQYPLVVLKKV